jgi:hypothetical protein
MPERNPGSREGITVREMAEQSLAMVTVEPHCPSGGAECLSRWPYASERTTSPSGKPTSLSSRRNMPWARILVSHGGGQRKPGDSHHAASLLPPICNRRPHGRGFAPVIVTAGNIAGDDGCMISPRSVLCSRRTPLADQNAPVGQCVRMGMQLNTQENATQSLLLSSDAITARVEELATQISRDYVGKGLLLVGVLKGAFVFLSDLMRSRDSGTSGVGPTRELWKGHHTCRSCVGAIRPGGVDRWSACAGRWRYPRYRADAQLSA